MRFVVDATFCAWFTFAKLSILCRFLFYCFEISLLTETRAGGARGERIFTSGNEKGFYCRVIKEPSHTFHWDRCEGRFDSRVRRVRQQIVPESPLPAKYRTRKERVPSREERWRGGERRQGIGGAAKGAGCWLVGVVGGAERHGHHSSPPTSLP